MSSRAVDAGPTLERVIASLVEWVAALPGAAETSERFARDGLAASIVPASPERSVLNSVAYTSTEALEASLAELGRRYDDAGVNAWTVWVPERDRRAAALLEAAGHTLDASPRAMAMALDERAFEEPEFEVTRDVDIATVAQLNERAYGLPPGDFGRALRRVPDGSGLHTYAATVDGEPVACAVAWDHAGGDCGVYFVATVRGARRRGLGRGLMAAALNDAHERGCRTTTLQATAAGRPVYERLGYQDLGALEMWERRR